MTTAIDALITLAAQDPREDVYASLFAALPGTSLFANCVLEDGSAGSVRILTYSVSTLRNVLRFFTSNTHSGLSKPFVGMRWENIVEMVVKDRKLEGVQIANSADDWVAFNTGELKARSSSVA